MKPHQVNVTPASYEWILEGLALAWELQQIGLLLHIQHDLGRA